MIPPSETPRLTRYYINLITKRLTDRAFTAIDGGDIGDALEAISEAGEALASLNNWVRKRRNAGVA